MLDVWAFKHWVLTTLGAQNMWKCKLWYSIFVGISICVFSKMWVLKYLGTKIWVLGNSWVIKLCGFTKFIDNKICQNLWVLRNSWIHNILIIFNLWVFKSFNGNQYYEDFKFVGTQICAGTQIFLTKPNLFGYSNFCRYSKMMVIKYLWVLNIVGILNVVTQSCRYSKEVVGLQTCGYAK